MMAAYVKEIRLKEKVKKTCNLTRAPVNCRPEKKLWNKGYQAIAGGVIT